MNVQVEHQPDHTARLTVQIDDETFSKAREKAARALSQKLNIPGFRKGKVPMRILINYIGEESLLNEAIDQMSQDVYRKALLESGVTPYGPGSFDDANIETLPPTLVYSVPLEPTVDLGDYRAIRVPYEAGVVSDEDVDRAMRMLQQEQALSEPSSRPAAMGDRINGSVHSYFVEAGDTTEAVPDSGVSLQNLSDVPDDKIPAEIIEKIMEINAEIEAELDDEDFDDDEFDDDDDHGDSVIDAYMSAEQDVYMHEHHFNFVLDADNEPAPGFSAALVGVNAGETRQFVLTLPTKEQDADVSDEAAGRSVRFIVHVEGIETITLPELTDDFAARITKDEEKPLTLLELRMRMRQNLDAERARQYDNDYLARALNLLVEGATMAYPEAMVDDHVHSIMEDFDQRLRRSGLTLEDYQRINNKTHEDLHVDFHDPAVNSVKRALAMQGLINAEQITIDETRVREELYRFAAQFGGEMQDMVLQQIAKDPNMANSVRSSLLQDAVSQRLIAIAKGEAPALDAAPESSSDGQAEDPAPTDTPQSAVTSANEES